MVFAVDKNRKPIGFVTERRARILREKKRADILNIYPFVIRINDVDADTFETPVPTYRIKIDPGTEWTGIAIVRDSDGTVCWYGKIRHRGYFVHKAMQTRAQTRAQTRRNRRNRELWYRKNKFWSFRTGPRGRGKLPSKAGWLPPSVRSVMDNVINWVRKLCQWVPISDCSFEACRFDTQLMDSPDIEGEQYQNGTLKGYEMKEYLMEKYRHTCQYCKGVSQDPVLEWEHKQPKSRGGTDSVKNAILACHTCNQDKGNRTCEEYLDSIKVRSSRRKEPTKADQARLECLPKVLAGRISGGSNRYAAWANILRKFEERELFAIFGEGHVECASGGRTKYNRAQLDLPKDHHFDALCVGTVPEDGYRDRTGGYVLVIEAMGRGTRFRGKINECGVIIKKLPPRPKRVHGFQNGDIVRVSKAKGKGAGTHVGRVMTRASGRFDVRTMKPYKHNGKDESLVTAKYTECTLLQRQSGYKFSMERISSAQHSTP